MKNLILSSLMHCPIVADVMSELSADYYPGVRMVDASTISADVATFEAMPESSLAPLRRRPVQSGRANMATVSGEVLYTVEVSE